MEASCNEFFLMWFFPSYLLIRSTVSDDPATLKQEASLSVLSCLQILVAVSSACDFNLLCDCLRSIETWVSVSCRRPEQRENHMTKDITRVVLDSFEVVKKWWKKKLMRTIPCYIIAETNKELEVFKLGHSLYCIKHPVPCIISPSLGEGLSCDTLMCWAFKKGRNGSFLFQWPPRVFSSFNFCLSFIVFVLYFYFFNS